MKEDEQKIIGRQEEGYLDELPNADVGDWSEMLDGARIGREETARNQLVNARIRANLADNYMRYNK